MPLPYFQMIDLTGSETTIRTSLEEARSVVQSLVLLVRGSNYPGIADWVTDTYHAMSRSERKTNELVVWGLHYAILPAETWNSFPAYLDHLASMDPAEFRDKMLNAYERSGEKHPLHFEDEKELIDLPTALSSTDQYLAYLRQRYSAENVIEDIERAAYELVIQPAEMQKVAVEHLRYMWQKYLAAEYQRARPLLQQALRALNQIDFKKLSIPEAARLVSSRDIHDKNCDEALANARKLLLVPHPHLGPYSMHMDSGDQTLILFIGARMPEGSTLYAPDLTRNEIMVRLDALTDDTRLRILRLIAEKGELRSQDIINGLEISQSTTSRHLTQLTATGFLRERRIDGAKSYSIDPKKVNDTLLAITNYLMVSERTRNEPPRS